MTKLTKENVPGHVAIILDGNRRWAKLRGVPSSVGHYQGLYKTLWPVVEEAQRQGVSYLTVFGFSSENWQRKEQEIAYLLQLFEQGMRRRIHILKKANVRLRVIGELARFPQSLQDIVRRAVKETSTNTGLTLTLALSYGGRQEIVRAAERLRNDSRNVTEQLFATQLYDAEMPDVDLLIRTSGEKRLSGFLLWQIAYAELYFTEVMWPDFSPKHFIQALSEFAGRRRRFGS